MTRSKDEQFLHDWVLRKIQAKYSRLYNEVHINQGEEKNFEFKGHYPDVVFINYGQVVLIAEVETRETITEDEVPEWKELSNLGVKLTVMVPKEMLNDARDICWKSGLAAKVNIAFFDVSVNI